MPDLALPIIASSIIAISGWFVVNLLSWRRTISEKQKERRLGYLITAYDNLRLFEENGLASYEDFERFRKLLNEIYLFGSLPQIKAVEEIPIGVAETIEINDINRLIVKETGRRFRLEYY